MPADRCYVHKECHFFSLEINICLISLSLRLDHVCFMLNLLRLASRNNNKLKSLTSQVTLCVAYNGRVSKRWGRTAERDADALTIARDEF